jgi:hypothetical protein
MNVIMLSVVAPSYWIKLKILKLPEKSFMTLGSGGKNQRSKLTQSWRPRKAHQVINLVHLTNYRYPTSCSSGVNVIKLFSFVTDDKA